MQDMASEDGLGARLRGVKRKASAAKPPPALESLPSSGDEDDGLDFVQQGRKSVIQHGVKVVRTSNGREGRTGRARPAQPPQSGSVGDNMPTTQSEQSHVSVAADSDTTKQSKLEARQVRPASSGAVPSKGRAQKASDRDTAAHSAAQKRKNEIKSLVNRGIHDPSAAFTPPRIDRNDKKAMAEASSMMHDLMELMRNERKLFSKGKMSNYFASAKEYSQALSTLLPIVKLEVAEDKKQVKDAQRKRKASEVDGGDELGDEQHASEPAKDIKTPEDALRILEQTNDVEKLKVIRDHLGRLSLSLNIEIDERDEQRSDPSNAGEYHMLDDDLYGLEFVQASLKMLRTIAKNKINTLGEEKRAADKAAPEAAAQKP